MLEKISDFSIKYRWLILIVFISIGLMFLKNIPKTEFDADIRSQLPDNMPSRLRLDKIEEVFGGTEIIVLGLSTDNILNQDTLKRVKKLSKEIKRLDSVERVMSLSETNDIRTNKNGDLLIRSFLKRVPRKEKDFIELKNYIMDNEMVYGNIVSKDFKATAITIFLKDNEKDEVIVSQLKKIVEENPGNEKISYAGLPYVRANSTKYMRSDMRKFMPIGILIMLIFLYICFRELKGVILPFSVVILSIFVSMGSIYLFGWKIQLVTIILPVILIAVANDYGIHVIAEYQLELRENPDVDKNVLIKNVVKTLTGPVIAAGLTTMAGLLCLISHIIVPAKQLGILAAIGIAFALIASIVFIPALLSIMPKSKIRMENGEHKLTKLEKTLQFWGRYIGEHPKKIFVVSIILVLIFAAGIFKIKVDTNPINYYKKSSEVVKSDKFINDNFGGSVTLSVMASGGVKDKKLMKDISDFDEKISKRERIGSVNSIADVMKKMNKVLHENNEDYDKVPDTDQAVSEYFLLYSMSGDPEDLEKMVDFNYENTLITERISSASVIDIKEELKAVKDTIAEIGNGKFNLVGGFADILSELVDATVNGQLISLVVSIFIVLIIVAMLFGSIWAGVFSVIPIVFAIMILFGLMGYFNIELNMITAMLTSIMIGVGVDYTIHFLWRFRSYKNAGETDVDAVFLTLTTSGRGIVFNALSVIIGFIALMFSNFLPVQFFGFLVVVSIATCLLAAIITLPAICIIFKPKFLRGNEK